MSDNLVVGKLLAKDVVLVVGDIDVVLTSLKEIRNTIEDCALLETMNISDPQNSNFLGLMELIGDLSHSSRRAARRGQGGRLTTLNVRTGAVTTLNFFHVLIFFMK